MDIATLKKRLQSHLTDGLVTIVGSGLSAAEGIPGMGALSKHIIATLPSLVEAASRATWDQISYSLTSGTDLESTLLAHPPDQHLESLIVDATAGLICPAEAEVFEQVLAGGRALRFSRLLRHLLKTPSGIPIITTNYDRLIELAAEVNGLGVDTLFVGHRAGRLDSRESKFNQCRGLIERKVDGKRKQTLDFAPHVRVLKPHGSLDWYQGQNGPLSCSFHLRHPRLIITPGLNKYRGGYDRPFDTHREAANREIDRASRFLIIGYGFNDEHLQTHLERRLLDGEPAVLITHSLSLKAKELLPKCHGMITLTCSAGDPGTIVNTPSAENFYPGVLLWDLGTFIDEVLTP
jgi:hypothetical protein